VSADSRARVALAANRLGEDELLVLAEIAERMVAGRAQYGEYIAGTDPRDHLREAAEEGMDAAVYLAMLAVRERARSAG